MAIKQLATAKTSAIFINYFLLMFFLITKMHPKTAPIVVRNDDVLINISLTEFPDIIQPSLINTFM